MLAALWVLLRNRIGVAYRIALAAIGYAVFVFSINNYASSSAFGDRTGTDWYRAQIDQAMEIKASLTPWTGLGLNQGFVVIGCRSDGAPHPARSSAPAAHQAVRHRSGRGCCRVALD